jgi:hypothetical protein
MLTVAKHGCTPSPSGLSPVQASVTQHLIPRGNFFVSLKPVPRMIILRSPQLHILIFLTGNISVLTVRGERFKTLDIWKLSMTTTLPTYLVRHLAGNFEELSCLVQLEDESAAMYFNIIHGSKLRRKFTTENSGKRCEDYVLIARAVGRDGSMEDRAVALFDLT